MYYKKIAFLLAILLLFNFITDIQRVNAEAITAGSALLYFAIATIAGGVTWYHKDDIVQGFNAFKDSIPIPDFEAFKVAGSGILSQLFTGGQTDLSNSILNNWVSDKFNVGTGEYNYADITGNVLRYTYAPTTGIQLVPNYNWLYDDGPVEEYKHIIFPGNQITVHYYSVSETYNYWEMKVDIYHNGDFVYSKTDTNIGPMYYSPLVENGIATNFYIGINEYSWTYTDNIYTPYYYSPTDDVGYAPPSQTVNYHIHNNSYYGGGQATMPQVYNPGLPYFPGVTTKETDGSISYDGTPEELLQDINTDAGLLEAFLVALLGVSYLDLQNDATAGQTTFDPEGGTISAPPITHVGVDDIPVPNVDIDNPAIDIPVDTQIPATEVEGLGILSWLLQYIANILQAIYGLLASLVGMLISALRDLLTWLFAPDAAVISNAFNSIKHQITQKIGAINPNGLLNFDFAGLPIPDGYIRGSKALDASYVNDIAQYTRPISKYIVYLYLAYFHWNSILRLIRGTGVTDGQKIKA